MDQSLSNYTNNMLFEEHIFRQISGSGFNVNEEIQISPDGTRLCAAQNNSGGSIFSFNGGIIQFLLDQDHVPTYVGQLAIANSPSGFITHLDFSSASNNVYFVQVSSMQGGVNKLYYQDVLDNNPTTYLADVRSAVRRLNDGNLYFTAPNTPSFHFYKIIGSNSQYPTYVSQEISDLSPLWSSTITLKPVFATQPHRLYPNKGLHHRLVGEKLYELTDHLGNVRTTITDRKIATFDSNWDITGYTADIKSANDYFPFGSVMPGRSYNSGDYRFGFNGKENDNEIKGSGNSIDYGFRVYDSRLGKFLSVDPLASQYPFLSTYQYASNNPIVNIDVDGLEGYSANGGGWVTNPPSNKCRGCGLISKEKYERIKLYYETEGKKGETPGQGMLHIYQPTENITGHNGTTGYYYSVSGKPLLEISVATQFEGSSDKLINEKEIDFELTDLVEKLKSYPTATISLTSNVGSDGELEGYEYGKGDEIYNISTRLNDKESTLGELMDARGETIKNKLIDLGVGESRINVERGESGSTVKHRKVDISVNIAD